MPRIYKLCVYAKYLVGIYPYYISATIIFRTLLIRSCSFQPRNVEKAIKGDLRIKKGKVRR